MARYFCRHADCGKPHECWPMAKPVICPACQKVAAWATRPGVGVIQVPHVTHAIDGWAPSLNDRRFLKSLKIDPEWPPVDPTIAANDPA